MTRKELADRLIEQNKGNPFMNITTIMDVLDIGYKKAAEVTSDLIPASKGKGKSNRAKYYFVDDIADAIMRKGL